MVKRTYSINGPSRRNLRRSRLSCFLLGFDRTLYLFITLLMFSLIPVLFFRFLPFHDYPNAVFQGYLLRLARENPVVLSHYYKLVHAPVPYSAWSVVAWALGYVLHSPEMVGKLFFVLTTLIFAGGTAYLIRSVQGYPTAFEFLPLAWVYNRYVYDGVLNYHLSLGLCFFTTGYLHRATRGGYNEFSCYTMLVLSCLSLITYFSHLLGWLPLCLAVAVYSCSICLRQRSFNGLRAMLSLLPAVILLSWYMFSRTGTGTIALYPSLIAKLYAWTPVLLLFFRLEPFGIQPPFAFLWNVGTLVAILAMTMAFADRQARCMSWHIAPMALALVCLACAILIPFYLFASMGPPDARFIQPALWLAVASIRYRSRTWKQVALVVILVTFVLVMNVLQFARIQRPLTEIFTTLYSVVPPEARVYSVSLRSPPLSLSDALSNTSLVHFTAGMPILDYFDLYRFMAQGRCHAHLGQFAVALLQDRQPKLSSQLVLDVLPRTNLRETADMILRRTETYELVELFGYPDDIWTLELLLAPVFTPIARGRNFSILRHH